jgi:two-component system, NarL family, sensor kinase
LRPSEFPRLAPELERTIFRIIQEALTNIVRHSDARNAHVSLFKEDEQLVIRVRDDGRGVPEQILAMRPGTIGVGIGGMRQRAKEFGGELRMQNASPGTLVEVLIPLTPDLLRTTALGSSTDSLNPLEHPSRQEVPVARVNK